LKNSTTQYQWSGIEVSLTSYKGVIGDTRMGSNSSVHQGSMPDCHATGRCPGLFWRHNYVQSPRFAHIRDGTSNTFMLGEDVAEHNYHSGAFHSNGSYSSCHGPLNYFPDPPTPAAWWNVMTFRSNHPGGAMFCMADSSVHFVSESIDYTLYRALSTKDGGEVATLP
jgi:hypothetical protein